MTLTKNSIHSLHFCNLFITATSDILPMPCRLAHKPTKRKGQAQTQYANTRRSKSTASLISRRRSKAFVYLAVLSRSTGMVPKASSHSSSTKGWVGTTNTGSDLAASAKTAFGLSMTIQSSLGSVVVSIHQLSPNQNICQLLKLAPMGGCPARRPIWSLGAPPPKLTQGVRMTSRTCATVSTLSAPAAGTLCNWPVAPWSSDTRRHP